MPTPDRIAVEPPYQLVRARHGWMLVNQNDLYIGRAISVYGEFSELETQFLLDLCSRPGSVVEVGANIGAHTVPLARQLAREGRRLVAFEPQPAVFQLLCANLALNALTNVRAWPYACGAEAGQVAFPEPDYQKPGNFGAVSVGIRPPEAGFLQAPCVKLDEVIGQEQVALLKIDVEGFEREVLDGARSLIARSRPFVYLENDRVDRSKELIEWLWSARYQLWWHTPPLYNPDNFFGGDQNLYPGIVSLNMVGIPEEVDIGEPPLKPVEDSDEHPLKT
jgi:FkbM family methyltransferase